MNNFYNSKTLNIFTDASVKSYQGEYYCCGGAVAIFGSSIYNIIDETFRVHRATNNYGELDSILQGILIALKLKSLYQNNIENINLFSDSAISVNGLREWIFGWSKRAKHGDYYNSDGALVANQELFKKIIYLITSNNLNINIFHMRGHIDKIGYTKAIQSFKSVNGIELSTDNIKLLAYMNNYVDNKSRNILSGYNITDIPYLNSMYEYTYPCDINSMAIYQNLLNLRRSRFYR